MALSVLDDLQQAYSIDGDSMHLELEAMFPQLARSYRDSGKLARGLAEELGERVRNVLLAGMGSSGMAADILESWLGPRSSVPVQVVKGYDLPGSAGQDTLFVGVSKSGETRETIWATREALRRGCKVACVSVGGRLRKVCSEGGVPFFRVGGSPWARTATLQLVGVLVAIVEGVLGLRGVSGEVEAADQALGEVSGEVALSMSTDRNPMKKATITLSDTGVAVLATYRLRAIGRRLVQQVNENSKAAACLGVMPDAMHNFVLQFRGTPDSSLVVLRGEGEDALMARLMEEVKDVVRERVSDVVEIRGRGSGDLAVLSTALLQVDYLSYYLSIVRGADPGPTPELTLLRKKLAGIESTSKIGGG
ncbi:MAG: SIS domain-containing protein [Candidatus Geothermarchaeales archaeon]